MDEPMLAEGTRKRHHFSPSPRKVQIPSITALHHAIL
jgi:hypothetical protein